MMLLAKCANALLDAKSYERRALLYGLMLLAPASQTLVWTGNMTLVSSTCALAGYFCIERRDWNIAAGVLTALSMSAKPQIGLWVVLFYLASRRWSLVLSCVATLGALFSAFASRLMFSGSNLILPYLRASTSWSGPDFASSDPRRFNLVNMQVLLSSFVQSRTMSNYLGVGIVAAMLAIWCHYFGRVRTKDTRTLAFGTLLTLSLLTSYHRVYDTILLAVPAIWAFGRVVPSQRKLQITLRVLLALFLIPSGSALVAAVEAKRISTVTQAAWWWTMLLMPHQVWLLLAISTSLLMCLRGAVLRQELSVMGIE
jgi:hypothetical protein